MNGHVTESGRRQGLEAERDPADGAPGVGHGQSDGRAGQQPAHGKKDYELKAHMCI